MPRVQHLLLIRAFTVKDVCWVGRCFHKFVSNVEKFF